MVVFTGFLVVILFANNMFGTKNNMERKLNPDLTVVKEGWEGNIVIDGQFSNDSILNVTTLDKAFKWMFSEKPQKEEKRNDKFKLTVLPFDVSAMQKNSIVWFGHSSFLIDINGIRLITDPNFMDNAINRRKAPLPCSVDSLKSIHYGLFSHDHRNHFDKNSIKTLLKNNPDMEALIPLGGNRLFTGKKLKNIKRQEAGWYQEYKLNEDIRIIFLPARHWGRRGLNDINKTLWGSFLIITNHTKIFFAGDTAYDEHFFKDIHNVFGDMDICMLTIGAYSPEWFMSPAHTTPEQAVQIFKELGGKWFIPMHYGVYGNSDEPPSEPLKRLRNCKINDQLKVLDVGEEFLFQ